MSVRKIRASWWVDTYIDGVRLRKRSPDNSRAGAKAYERLLLSRVARGEHLAPPPEVASPLFDEFVVEWFATYVKVNNKASEQRAKEGALTRHLVPWFGHLRLHEIGTKAVEEYKTAKLAQGLGAKTINNHLTMLRKCLRCALEWERLKVLPFIRPLKALQPSIDFLSDDECARLLSIGQLEPIAHAMLLTALRTGLRLSELCALKWTDLDFDRRTLTVQRSIVRGIEGSPKSYRIRYIPMTTDLCQVLTDLPRVSDRLFPNRTGTAQSDRQAARLIERACRIAGVRPIGWHRLRHTFASQLVGRGVPMRAVQELLGHSTITMTERYAHLAPSSLSDAVRVLETSSSTAILGNRWATLAPSAS